MKKRKPRKPRPYRVAASVIVKQPGRMTARGARQVAAWLRRQAGFLEEYRRQLTDGDLRARYVYGASSR